MKIRNGFVSNSSSSSFCIFGTEMDMSELLEKIKTTEFLTEAEIEEAEGYMENGESYEVREMVENKSDLEFHSDEDDTIWIGKSWSNIDDDQTGRQFKKSVEEDLESMLGDVDCDTHQEEIYS